MRMRLLALLLCFLLVNSLETVYEKCCGEDSYLAPVNSTYVCDDVNITKRFQILTDNYNFWENKTDGQCADVTNEGIIIYKVEKSAVVELKPVKDVFRKCCPLGSIYNTITHSCLFSTNQTHLSIKDKFLAIGLKQCKIVTDHEFLTLEQTEKSSKTHCIDTTQRNRFVRRECEENTDVCKKENCVKKCCPDGQSFVRGKNCEDTFVYGIDFDNFPHKIENPNDNYTVVYNAACANIYPWSDSIMFNLRKNGVLRYWENISDSFIEEDVFNEKSYCIDHAISRTGTKLGYRFFYCSKDVALEEKFVYTKWSKIVSCVGLILTIAVYVVLQETKTMFGKLLLNYCIATLGTMIILLYAHTIPKEETSMQCQTRAFFLILFSNAQFTLLSTMGLDIWWNFGSPRQTFGGESRRKNLKRLLLYFLYGWLGAILLTLLPFVFVKYEILPKSIQPYIGNFKCFWEDGPGNYATALFYHLPHLLIEICNTILCIKTILYCLRVKNEISRINDANRGKKKVFNADRDRLTLVIKLAVIMGVSFLFEVISAFFDMKKNAYTKILEIVWDNFNLLQGAFIFIIFICKKKILNNLRSKFRINKRKISSSTTHSINTQSTDVTSLNLNTINGSRKLH